jgi:hypothetical protein
MAPTNFNRKTKKICLSQKKVVPLRAFCCKIPQTQFGSLLKTEK